MLRLTDLREILHYVPRFRDKVFVIALDGTIVEEENFRNLLLDIALLRSLRIDVVLVHGAGHQIQRLAEQTGQQPSDLTGVGITDEPTLQLALSAANRVSHEILEGLSVTDLRGACGNAIVAHPAGILQGVDYRLTGRAERVETDFLRALLANDIVPVIPPIGCDGEGNSYRLNSDSLAVEVARALGAVKVIFLTCEPGVRVRTSSESDEPGQLIRQLSVEEAQTLLRDQRDAVSPNILSKLTQAVRATQKNVPRVHIIDGRVEEGLLGEVFSNEGIGTLIYANDYRSIRRAQPKDVRALHNLIQQSIANDELLPRSRSDLEEQINDFFLYELDGSPIGCVALHMHPDEHKAELACLCVDQRSENKGVGSKLMQYLEQQARIAGVRTLFCLSTQTFNYFQQKGGFVQGSPDDLPPSRRTKLDASGRHSLVLVKRL